MDSHIYSLSAGAWIAARRGACGLTQEGLSGRANLSLRQVQRLEQGGQIPTESQMVSIAAALGCDEAARNHLRHLVFRPHLARSVEVDSTDQVILDRLHPHLAAVLDWNWDILGMNEAYRDIFPGIAECGNVLQWLLLDGRSRECMVEWKSETQLTIRWWKYNLASRGENERSLDIYRRCSTSNIFRTTWGETDVKASRSEPGMWINQGGIATKIFARLYSSPLSDGRLYYLGVKE